MDFMVTPDVLIPRPETECLVEQALQRIPPDRGFRVLEIGVGSGALTGALALERPRARFVATDRSREALTIASANLERLGVADRVTLVCSDLATGIAKGFDLLVSNPPYVERATLPTLAPELRHEPAMALDGGPDGLEFVRRLLGVAPSLLERPGDLLLEVGQGQAETVAALLLESAVEVRRVRDLAGIERVVCAHFDHPERGATPELRPRVVGIAIG